MEPIKSKLSEMKIILDRALSSEAIALQLAESISQHSRPGQPATPDQVLPFLNAASLHSSDAAALWRDASRDLSASPGQAPPPAEQLHRASTSPDQALETNLIRGQQHAQSASQWRKHLTDMCADTQLRGTSIRSGQRDGRLSVAAAASLRLQPDMQNSRGGEARATGTFTEDLQASEHSAAQTEISQSAGDDAMHCSDSMASAMAPLMQRHVRSKPALPAEVTDDSENLSSSASDKALHLSLAELRALFGVPLTEAAARLGVQRRDLVRSCRRHNLEGWPRRSISVTEAARSNASTPTSAPSNADASELAAFMPFKPAALRSAPLACQARSVHTRSSSRVGANRAHTSGASTRKPSSPQVQDRQQEEPAAKASQQGSAKDGLLPDTTPAGITSLPSWSTIVGQGMLKTPLLTPQLTLQVPTIQLDRPGMWAPKILQGRARAREATSIPTLVSNRARPGHPSTAANEPTAASLTFTSAHCPAALRDQGARDNPGLQRATEASGEQASQVPADKFPRQREAAVSPERQLESHTDTAHPPGPSPEPESDTAAKPHAPAVSADVAQLAPVGSPASQRMQFPPSKSAPLQGCHALCGKGRRRSGELCKTLSAPLISVAQDLPGEDEAAKPAVHQACPATAAGTLGNVASKQVHTGSQGEQDAQAEAEHALESGRASELQKAAAAAAGLMFSPFMQTLALSEGQTLAAKVPGNTPVQASVCDAGVQSSSQYSRISTDLYSQISRPVTLPEGLAKPRARQLSRQSPQMCLPPKKRLQMTTCSQDAPPPAIGDPATGQTPHTAVLSANVNPCAEAEPSAAEPAKAYMPVAKSAGDKPEKPSEAGYLLGDNDQVTDAQPVAAKQVQAAGTPATAVKPRRRPGRPPGSVKAAREKALGPALPACSPEGKRPLKKSRKALEAEQAGEARLSLGKELRSLLEHARGAPDMCEAPAAEKGRSNCSADGQQPEQAARQGWEQQPPASKAQLMPQTPTSISRCAFLGSLKLPRPDSGQIGEDMTCSEKLPEHIPDALDTCLNTCLNLSPPPALPGTTFGGSVCNSLLGSPLPHMDSPKYHEAFYGYGLHDLSLGTFNDIADSSFSFGCFNN